MGAAVQTLSTVSPFNQLTGGTNNNRINRWTLDFLAKKAFNSDIPTIYKDAHMSKVFVRVRCPNKLEE